MNLKGKNTTFSLKNSSVQEKKSTGQVLGDNNITWHFHFIESTKAILFFFSLGAYTDELSYYALLFSQNLNVTNMP